MENLTQPQILYLLTILRGPNYYINNPLKTIKRYEFLNNVFLESNLISNNRHQKNIKSKIEIGKNHLFNIKNEAVPFITEFANHKKKLITSTIDIKIQLFVNAFVRNSKYPISIIAIKKEKVVGFASSYGNDYPFTSKSNVGSTLKPFVYCHLRENGISKKERFNAYKNDLGINIREAGYYGSSLSIEQALLHSNNNVFINASNKVGMDKTLLNLSDTLGNKNNSFFVSSILGSTKKGISLYELAFAYSSFFTNSSTNEIKKECLKILNRIFTDKLGLDIENAFLKTGTTNDNKERYVVLGNPDITYAVLRNENYINDESKEGNFMEEIKRGFMSFFESEKNYKWI